MASFDCKKLLICLERFDAFVILTGALFYQLGIEFLRRDVRGFADAEAGKMARI